MPRLVVKLGNKKQQTIELDVETLVIGRGSVAKLRLDHELVSREHCRIRDMAGKLVVEDTSSTGTFVNGKKVDAHVLRDGDVIEVGPYTLLFGESDGPAAGDQDAAAAFWSSVASAEGVRVDEQERKEREALQDDAVPASAMPDAPEFAQMADWDGTVPASTTQIQRVREQLVSSQKPHLVVTTKKGVDRIMLEAVLMTISNQRGADYRLPGGPFARRNGFLVRRTAKGGYEVEPLDSASKVAVAGSKLEGAVPMADGVVVEAAGLKFRYREGS